MTSARSAYRMGWESELAENECGEIKDTNGSVEMEDVGSAVPLVIFSFCLPVILIVYF